MFDEIAMPWDWYELANIVLVWQHIKYHVRRPRNHHSTHTRACHATMTMAMAMACVFVQACRRELPRGSGVLPLESEAGAKEGREGGKEERKKGREKDT